MARKNQIDYPTIFGDRKVGMWNHTGPASYVAVINGTPASGGDSVPAAELISQTGMRFADVISGLLGSDNGQYEVTAIPIDGNAQRTDGFVPSKNWILRWLVSATGAEVAPGVNLSARTVKLLALGPK